MIKIRPAEINEKRKTYEWLCKTDTTSMHMGLPNYPEIPIPTWEEYEEDFEDFYFQTEYKAMGAVLIIEKDNEEIGCMCYATFHLKDKMAELDIWLKGKEYCGKGFGTIALKNLLDYLRSELNIKNFIIRPAEKNIPAIKAYQKVGFVNQQDKVASINKYLLPEYLQLYGDGDYGFENTAVLTLELE